MQASVIVSSSLSSLQCRGCWEIQCSTIPHDCTAYRSISEFPDFLFNLFLGYETVFWIAKSQFSISILDMSRFTVSVNSFYRDFISSPTKVASYTLYIHFSSSDPLHYCLGCSNGGWGWGESPWNFSFSSGNSRQSSTPLDIPQDCVRSLGLLEIPRPKTKTPGNSTLFFLHHPWKFHFI